MAGFVAITFSSCAGGEGNGRDAETAEKDRKERIGQELVINIGDEVVEFEKVNIRFEDVFDGIFTITGRDEPTETESGTLTEVSFPFHLEFMGTEPGELQSPSLSINGYVTNWVRGETDHILFEQGMFGKKLESIEGSFEAEIVGLLDGTPSGEPIRVKGAFQK